MERRVKEQPLCGIFLILNFLPGRSICQFHLSFIGRLNHMAKTDIKPMEKYNGALVRFKKKDNNYAPFIVL